MRCYRQDQQTHCSGRGGSCGGVLSDCAAVAAIVMNEFATWLIEVGVWTVTVSVLSLISLILLSLSLYVQSNRINRGFTEIVEILESAANSLARRLIPSSLMSKVFETQFAERGLWTEEKALQANSEMVMKSVKQFQKKMRKDLYGALGVGSDLPSHILREIGLEKGTGGLTVLEPWKPTGKIQCSSETAKPPPPPPPPPPAAEEAVKERVESNDVTPKGVADSALAGQGDKRTIGTAAARDAQKPLTSQVQPNSNSNASPNLKPADCPAYLDSVDQSYQWIRTEVAKRREQNPTKQEIQPNQIETRDPMS